MLKNYDLAITDYSKLIALGKYVPSAFHGRALVYYERGQMDRALGDVSKAIQRNSNAAHRITRGRIYAKLGKRKRAESDFRAALMHKNASEEIKEAARRGLKELGIKK